MDKTEQNKVLLFINSEGSEVYAKIEEAFLRNNFEVYPADSPTQIITILREKNPHLIVASFELWETIVNSTTQRICQSYNKTGIILIHNNKTSQQRIQAMEKGADDCISLSSEIEELIAKSKAIIRRIYSIIEEPKIIKAGDITINLDAHQVFRGSKLINLTYTELKIICLLTSKRDYVFTRNEILNAVRGDENVTQRTVDVYIRRLREKLGEHKKPSKYIQTIHGLGYKFV